MSTAIPPWTYPVSSKSIYEEDTQTGGLGQYLSSIHLNQGSQPHFGFLTVSTVYEFWLKLNASQMSALKRLSGWAEWEPGNILT
jgi:hypothetical protein